MEILPSPDQLLESFRRKKLVLFLTEVVKNLNLKVRIEQSNKLTIINRFNESKSYSSTSDQLLRPEYQEMIRVSEISGYVKRKEVKTFSTTDEPYLMVLTEVGLLLLETEKFNFKGFIPVLGTKLKDNSAFRQDVKGGTVYSVEIILSGAANKETLVFSSLADKQEWVNKLMKVQHRADTK